MAVTPSTLPDNIDRLARKAQALCCEKDETSRVIISVAGIPGCGKTTLGQAVATRVAQIQGADAHHALSIPMDGFHLSRAQLSAMADPGTAIHRRGAAFTFDAEAYHGLVQSLRKPVNASSPVIYAPSFDHAIKDPVAGDIAIGPESKVIIIEGLYLSLDRDPWKQAAELIDEAWFIDVDREVARARLVKRHIASGIVADAKAAEERIRTTDFLNADDIIQNRLPVQEIVPGN